MKIIEYDDRMSWQEKRLLFNLLDKYINTTSICNGKCNKCYFNIKSFNKPDIHCPLIIARELIDYMDISECDYEHKMG